MESIDKVIATKFYEELNRLLRKRLSMIEQGISRNCEQTLASKGLQSPLPLTTLFESSAYQSNRQWRLELDFGDYQWSNKTVKPHFLNALIYISAGKDSINLKYQLCSSFNDDLNPMAPQTIPLSLLNDSLFVESKINEVSDFLDRLATDFLIEVEKIDINELEYCMHPKIQEKWKQGYLPGYDCIIMGDGEIIIADSYVVYDPNTNESKRYWSTTCDTTLESLEKYNDDIWVEVDIFHGGFEHENQKFVFGDGGMGNEGYIAATSWHGTLDWAIFFTFSNPIIKAKIKNGNLFCFGDSGAIIEINLKKITDIKVSFDTAH